MVPCGRPVGMGFRSGIKDVMLFHNTGKQGWQDLWAPPLEEWKHWPTATMTLLRPETRNFQRLQLAEMWSSSRYLTWILNNLHVPQEVGSRTSGPHISGIPSVVLILQIFFQQLFWPVLLHPLCPHPDGTLDTLREAGKAWQDVQWGPNHSPSSTWGTEHCYITLTLDQFLIYFLSGVCNMESKYILYEYFVNFWNI